MSVTILASLIIRFVTFVLAIRFYFVFRERMIAIILSVVALMMLRQGLTLWTSGSFFPLRWRANLDELPGLAVSILMFLGLLGAVRLVKRLSSQAKIYEQIIKGKDDATQRLRESEERFALAMKGSNEGLWEWNLRTGEFYRSDRWWEIIGYRPDDLPNSYETFISLLHSDEKDRVLALTEALPLPKGETFDFEFRMRHKAGHWVDILARAIVGEEKGIPVRVIGTHLDISAWKAAERAKQESQQRLELAMQQAVIWDWDVENDVLFISDRFCQILGYGMDEFKDLQKASLINLIHADDRPSYRAGLDQHLQEPGGIFSHEHRFRKKDGSYVWFLARGHSVANEQNKVVRSCGILSEISDRKKLENKLFHAQKMESIGQLTGGIAHDFNNLLAVIQGNAELMEFLTPEQSEITQDIIEAANRGAELTQRLLAFSKRQTLQPENIDLGALAKGMSELLARTLGETIDVEIRIGPELWNAFADRGQVESALLNLAINSRDAMPDGGMLTIECKNAVVTTEIVEGEDVLPPGDYVMLSVADQGVGISKELRKHIFEPFFTTKDVGEGSGLGLSMIYGFAQQSGGQVVLTSELGQGTIVQIYLPRSQTNKKDSAVSQIQAVESGNGERILVLEDAPDVRKLTETMLRNLGYDVLTAEDASAAHKLVRRGEEFDLVLSDVVLPGGVSGPDFIEDLKRERPELKYIFMSGYPAVASASNGFIKPGSVLLNKPFRIAELAAEVRKAMAG